MTRRVTAIDQRELDEALARLGRHPALSPLSTTTVIEMPCCGFTFGSDYADATPAGGLVGWTCPLCERAWTETDGRLEEATQ